MKTKTTLVAIMLILGSLTTLMAQEKFDLAVVGYRYDTPKSQIYISINGEKSEQYDVEREQLEGKIWGVSMNPLLKAVNKMQNEGWEVVGGMTASGLPSISLFYYSLRKKR
ncbi:MAG TPA: hypothetical protein VK174_17570 [Chitinophagales bacterium]|nr:hypothetical protein [Chitinophagales bacterium]